MHIAATTTIMECSTKWVTFLIQIRQFIPHFFLSHSLGQPLMATSLLNPTTQIQGQVNLLFSFSFSFSLLSDNMQQKICMLIMHCYLIYSGGKYQKVFKLTCTTSFQQSFVSVSNRCTTLSGCPMQSLLLQTFFKENHVGPLFLLNQYTISSYILREIRVLS